MILVCLLFTTSAIFTTCYLSSASVCHVLSVFCFCLLRAICLLLLCVCVGTSQHPVCPSILCVSVSVCILCVSVSVCMLCVSVSVCILCVSVSVCMLCVSVSVCMSQHPACGSMLHVAASSMWQHPLCPSPVCSTPTSFSIARAQPALNPKTLNLSYTCTHPPKT
jgi:hypothetical protein